MNGWKEVPADTKRLTPGRTPGFDVAAGMAGTDVAREALLRAEAENEKLREALERITDEEVDITTRALTFRALDHLRGIAREALDTFSKDEAA